MKKMLAVLLVAMFLCNTAYALTDEQLREAKGNLATMSRKVRTMAICVNIAIDGKRRITNKPMTAEEKADLIEFYTNAKAELQTLYQQLP